MLVLTRKQGESIRIGDDVVITVVRTKGKAVRLGIQAPLHVPVLRGEIAVAIAAQETERSAVTPDELDGQPEDEADERTGLSLTESIKHDSTIDSLATATSARPVAFRAAWANRALAARLDQLSSAQFGSAPLRELVQSRAK